MISVLTIGSLYWSSQHPINRETGYSNVQSILGHLGPFLPLGAILGKSSLNDHWSTNSTERSGPNQACHAKDIARQSARQVLAILGQYELLWAIWTTLGHLVWEGWCIWSPVSLWPPWTHLAIYIIRTAIVDANVAQPGGTVEHNNGGRPIEFVKGRAVSCWSGIHKHCLGITRHSKYDTCVMTGCIGYKSVWYWKEFGQN